MRKLHDFKSLDFELKHIYGNIILIYEKNKTDAF